MPIVLKGITSFEWTETEGKKVLCFKLSVTSIIEGRASVSVHSGRVFRILDKVGRVSGRETQMLYKLPAGVV